MKYLIIVLSLLSAMNAASAKTLDDVHDEASGLSQSANNSNPLARNLALTGVIDLGRLSWRRHRPAAFAAGVRSPG